MDVVSSKDGKNSRPVREWGQWLQTKQAKKKLTAQDVVVVSHLLALLSLWCGAGEGPTSSKSKKRAPEPCGS